MKHLIYSTTFALGILGGLATDGMSQTDQSGKPKAEMNKSEKSVSASKAGASGNRGDMKQRRAKLRNASGEVVKIKEVKAKGTGPANRMVLIKTTKENRRLLVDLGPAEQLKDMDIKIGSKLSAQGPVIVAGDRIVMVASQVKMNDKTATIERKAPERNQSAQAGSRDTPENVGASGTRSGESGQTGQAGQAAQAGQEKATDYGIFVITATVEPTGGNVDEIITEDDEIKENPEKYIGKTIILRGEVNETIGTSAMKVDYDGLVGGDEILVIGSKDTLKTVPEKGTMVQLKGVVRSFETTTLEKDLGVDLDPEMFREYEKRPVIVASAIY